MRSFVLTAGRAGWVFLLVSLGSSTADAVVEQSDGTVVPVQLATCPGSGNPNGCVQVGLNTGEGYPATSTTNPLKAIYDAAISPEVFAVPKTNNVYGQVTVQDLIEGAGYENSFGWYNVDAPGTLYVITPCADEPGSSRTVDFQTEYMQGRYLGGFIGFFLVTPENAPIGNNCGALNNVGHIYYTEQAKNGDGNYVHYLLYHSKANTLAYYFGFEDLFRGGDNDFEDMFLKVTGLLSPCTPTAEICDGQDNNCDGLIDNNPIDAGGQCGPTDIGECSPGTMQCQGGTLVCVGGNGPTPELCNGLDDNCNGMIDDAPTDVGQQCGTDVGECSYGTNQCIGGVVVCVGGKGPTLETCNTLDDDCNGVPDDNPIDSGGPCGSNIGACQPGVLTCVGGTILCTGGMTGTPEVCNSIDDDCNGAIDDGNPGGGAPCGSDVGICEPGIEHCVGGMIICVGAVGPAAEICDGLDNDCDGTGDNLAPCPGMSKCVSGNCAEPCKSGEFPCGGGQVCINGFCMSDPCTGVMCNPGEICVAGTCMPGSGGGGPGGGGPGSSSATGSNSSSVSTGSASTGSGTSSSAGAGGAAAQDTDVWGLPTGGGGAFCTVDRAFGHGRTAGVFGLVGAIALGFLRRLHPHRARRAARRDS